MRKREVEGKGKFMSKKDKSQLQQSAFVSLINIANTRKGLTAPRDVLFACSTGAHAFCCRA